jgi:hypothetical protein
MIVAIPIEEECARRGIRLVGRGAERCGPCPVCGGRDRFSINVKKQLWFCRACDKGGDVLDLIQHLDNVDFRTARNMLGCDQAMPDIKPKVADQRNIAVVLRLWEEATPIAGTLAATYLKRRGLEPPTGCDALRFHRSCPFGGGSYPCMVALYRDIHTNEPKAIHRTALGTGGIKLDRKALGPIAGSAIKLSPDDEVTMGLVIGEGVETALAGMQLGFRPAWALGSAGGIKAFPVLAGIESLTVLVDNDEADRNGRRAGQDAAAACSERWTAAGREVLRVVPRRLGADMADLVGGARNEE